MSDLSRKLIDLSFVLIPGIFFVGLFFLMELKRKKALLKAEELENKKKLKL